jgi:serine/threonine protein kinase
LSDFGVRKILQEGMTRSFKGTIYSIVPEIIEGDDYTTKADLWSIGIMMYQLLLKKNLFPARNQEELLKMIYMRQPAEDIKDFRLTDLVGKFLTPDPNKRISWEEYFLHIHFLRLKILF